MMADMHAEEERLRSAVTAEADAFKAAEQALEAALVEVERRVQESKGVAAAPMFHQSAPAPMAPRAPALSELGSAALATLEAQLAALASPENIAKAEEEYAQLDSEQKPSLLQFALQRLSAAGSRHLDLVKFDLAKDMRTTPSVARRAPLERPRAADAPAADAARDRSRERRRQGSPTTDVVGEAAHSWAGA